MTEQPYYLLPFDFTEISGKEVLVNELGDMIVSVSYTHLTLPTIRLL